MLWAGLCIYGQVMTEYDERDETRKWVEMLLDDTEPLRGYSLMPDRRHDALMAMRTRGQFMRTDALAFVRAAVPERVSLRRPVRFVDAETEQQYVRAGEVGAYVRHVAGADPLPHTTLRARLHEIGVQRRYQRTTGRRTPKRRCTRAYRNARRIRRIDPPNEPPAFPLPPLKHA